MTLDEEEALIRRVAKQMFGEQLALTPQIVEIVKPIFRKYLEDIQGERAA